LDAIPHQLDDPARLKDSPKVAVESDLEMEAFPDWNLDGDEAGPGSPRYSLQVAEDSDSWDRANVAEDSMNEQTDTAKNQLLVMIDDEPAVSIRLRPVAQAPDDINTSSNGEYCAIPTGRFH
jgi:hypothetical protein